MSTPIHHFFHCYADGDCEVPIREWARALKESGLYDALTTLKIGFVGSTQKILEAKHCIGTLGIEFQVADEQPYGWEQVTMIPMHEFSKTADGLMLYAHTKGASSRIDVNERWRRSMYYWNIIRWRLAVHELTTRAHAYGTHWIQPTLNMPEHVMGNFMFAGTMFWLRCEVMARHPKPALTHRWEAEGYCGYGWHEQPYPVFDPAPYFPNSGPFADAWVLGDISTYIPEHHPPKFYDI